MAESFASLDSVLRDWVKDEIQKSVAEALNKYEKQEENWKILFRSFTKWLRKNTRALPNKTNLYNW